jgi:transposase
VCAIDVAKASGTVCIRIPEHNRADRRVSRVWDVAATADAVTELADHLIEQGIEKVTVEATSDYCRIWFYLLEAAGLDVQLVNAREVKNVPGRPKTDLDAVWLAKLTEKGMAATGEAARKRLAAQWSVFSCRRQARFRVAGFDLLVHLDRRFGPIWAYGF